MEQKTIPDGDPVAGETVTEVRHKEVLLKAGTLPDAIFNRASFPGIVTGAKGVIPLFNAGAARRPGYAIAAMMNGITQLTSPMSRKQSRAPKP